MIAALDPHYHESAVSTISILPEDVVDMNLPIRDMSVTPITPQCAKKYSNAKSFTCFTCAKIFSKRSYLIRHERKHTGEKPYTCMTCGRSFSAIGNLTRHKRTHSESSKATTDGGNNQDFINFGEYSNFNLKLYQIIILIEKCSKILSSFYFN